MQPVIRSRASRCLVVLCALAGAAGAAPSQVWVVDDDGGPGIDFTSIQDAVDAAGEGDAILVRQGTYAPVVVDGKSLRVVAEAGEIVVISNAADIFAVGLRVRNLSSSQAVVVRGVDVHQEKSDFFTFAITLAVPPAIRLDDCAGSVWLEACQAFGSVFNTSFGPQIGRGEGIRVRDCAAVTLASCRVEGYPTPWYSGAKNDVGAPHGIKAVRSNLTLYGSTIAAGVNTGGSAAPPEPGHGVLLDGGFLYAAGSTLLGSEGGGGGPPPGIGAPSGCDSDGGDGLRVRGGGLAYVLDTALVPGAAGSGQVACFLPEPAVPGSDVFVEDGGFTPFPGRSYLSSAWSPVREGDTAVLTFFGEEGELVFLGFSSTPFQFFFEPFTGVSELGFPADSIFLGLVPAGDQLDVPVTIAELGPGVSSHLFYLQPAIVTLQGAIVLGAPTELLLLDDAL